MREWMTDIGIGWLVGGIIGAALSGALVGTGLLGYDSSQTLILGGIIVGIVWKRLDRRARVGEPPSLD